MMSKLPHPPMSVPMPNTEPPAPISDDSPPDDPLTQRMSHTRTSYAVDPANQWRNHSKTRSPCGVVATAAAKQRHSSFLERTQCGTPGRAHT